MNTKQLPMIEEAPLIVVGLTVATAAILAGAAIAGTARVFLRLTGLGRPAHAN